MDILATYKQPDFQPSFVYCNVQIFHPTPYGWVRVEIKKREKKDGIH